MFARVASAAVVGIEAAPIDVEVDVGVGLPVAPSSGSPTPCIREGRVRIRGALENSGSSHATPDDDDLAPADLRRTAPR